MKVGKDLTLDIMENKDFKIIPYTGKVIFVS
jgi:hypothetical protein